MQRNRGSRLLAALLAVWSAVLTVDPAALHACSMHAPTPAAAVSSDGGALLLAETDRAIKLVDRFTACFRDSRNPFYVVHEMKTLVAQRVFGLALGYP